MLVIVDPNSSVLIKALEQGTPRRGKEINECPKHTCNVASYRQHTTHWVTCDHCGQWFHQVDTEHAYRNVPVHPDDRPLLCMKWQGELLMDTVLRSDFGLHQRYFLLKRVSELLGITLKRSKGHQWSLGTLVDTQRMELTLPEAKLHEIKELIIGIVTTVRNTMYSLSLVR